jgi:hypothetical protein
MVALTQCHSFGVFLEQLNCIPCNRGCFMKRILVTCVAVSLGAASCFAASPKIEEIVKTFKAVSADAGKLKIFCEMTKAMDAMADKQDTAIQDPRLRKAAWRRV